MNSYIPMPGTIPARVIAWLQENPGEAATTVIAEALGLDESKQIHSPMAPAIQHGLVRATKRGRLTYWSLGQPAEAKPRANDARKREPLLACVLWANNHLQVRKGRQRIDLSPTDARVMMGYFAHMTEYN